MATDPPRSASAERNKQPIADLLADLLPETGEVLEVASGTGQHVAWFARRFPGLQWQPTDPDPAALRAIPLWTAGLANIGPPLALDVTNHDWPVDRADAVVCINMVHIAPWAAAEGLMAGAGRVLAAGGLLFLYGPFRQHGRHTAPSNERFDRSLRHRHPDWGIRDMGEIAASGAASGLTLREAHPMPANNFTLIFEKRG